MINRSTSEVGLFGSTVRGAKIVNASLLSVDVQGNDYVGGLVGFHRHSSIAKQLCDRFCSRCSSNRCF